MRMLCGARNKVWNNLDLSVSLDRQAQASWGSSRAAANSRGRTPAGAGQVPARFAPFGHRLAAVDGRWRGMDLTHTFPRG